MHYLIFKIEYNVNEKFQGEFLFVIMVALRRAGLDI